MYIVCVYHIVPGKCPRALAAQVPKFWGRVVTWRRCLNGSTIPEQRPTPDATFCRPISTLPAKAKWTLGSTINLWPLPEDPCQPCLPASNLPRPNHPAHSQTQNTEENQASCHVAKSTCIVGSSILRRGQPNSGEDCIMLQSGLTRSLVAKFPQRSVRLCYANIMLQGRNAVN